MRLRILLLCVVLLPTLASAEIYKWRDKDGVTRYSDVPPPSNIKQEAMYGKKNAKPTGLAPLAPIEGDVTTALNRDKAATLAKAKAEKAPLSKEEAAQKRAQDAEKQKQVDEQKKAELATKQMNCTAAKQNLATYTNGGRISKTDENGKKQYLGDADIAQGKADAQRDVEKYCD
jgi:ribonuclease D